MQRLRTVTSLDVSAVAEYHVMPAALLFINNFDYGMALVLFHLEHFKRSRTPASLFFVIRYMQEKMNFIA